MARKKAPEDLSVEELRRLLVEKRRGARKERLENFRRTGRVLSVTPEPSDFTSDRSAPIVDTAEAASSTPEPAPANPRRKFMDRVLLGVEVLAVLGLIAVLMNSLGMLRTLNTEVASALNPETVTPTPLVMAVVLPSGHTPPDAQGNTRPNEAEIPEHLRPMVQSLVNLPVPTAAPDQAVRIQIPALSIDAPIVQGDGWEQLKKGVGQNIGSSNPGQDGNVVLSAHNDVYGEIFRYLDRLAPGDQVIVYTQQRQYTYVVDRTILVEPTAVEVMASTGTPTVTLISCYPYLVNKQRIVVFARLQN
ncbi:MAG: class D sortase [Anaerolineales bacterium]|uniref:sortase n=1 Tax=Candidatus Villigracilis affinis TaxID=3140682 RepID=UPI001B53F966|nr:class D sortase [Anaerolineales bacterium]MBK9604022.1 class D sortase [Anaerolineales bacterium]MBL0348712.1 class D sortase [Anaerolineales bacterium]MBP8048065.1 class D sortase [Anaerolineales bacterium]